MCSICQGALATVCQRGKQSGSSSGLSVVSGFTGSICGRVIYFFFYMFLTQILYFSQMWTLLYTAGALSLLSWIAVMQLHQAMGEIRRLADSSLSAFKLELVF